MNNSADAFCFQTGMPDVLLAYSKGKRLLVLIYGMWLRVLHYGFLSEAIPRQFLWVGGYAFWFPKAKSLAAASDVESEYGRYEEEERGESEKDEIYLEQEVEDDL